jgi:hypothetical protein
MQLDTPFTENDLHGPSDGPQWLIEPAERPVVFTAVHGVVHHRPLVGSKSAEARTGGLVLALGTALRAGVGVILRTTEGADANFDPDHPFKRALLRQGLIGVGTALLDLHGMTDHHPVDIAIGRGADPERAEPLAELAVTAFEEQGFGVDPDGARCGLTGSGPGTVTTFAQRHGAIAIQVEIARRNRTFLTGSDRRLRLLKAFAVLADRLDALLRGAAGSDQ